MLDKNDIKQVKDIVVSSLGEFFENVLAPYLDKKFRENDNDHDTYFRKLEMNELQHGEILEKLEEHDEKLEQNDRDHKQIIEKLDEIEKNTRDHEGRIKKIEKVLSTS